LRLVRSTIPVCSFGPFPGRGWWCQMCSSTPTASTPTSRSGSSANSSSSGLIACQTVCQSTPSRRATEATEALSHWMQLIAHQAARTVSLARDGANAWSSLKPRTGQAGSAQR
jgi:hypothetical protein